MTPRTGRPPSDNPKRNNTRIRMTDEQVEMLNYCCKVLGLTKTEVIAQGLTKMYEKALKEAKK